MVGGSTWSYALQTRGIHSLAHHATPPPTQAKVKPNGSAGFLLLGICLAMLSSHGCVSQARPPLRLTSSASSIAQWKPWSHTRLEAMQGSAGRRGALSAWLCGLSAALSFFSTPRRAGAQARSSEAILCENGDLTSVAFPVWSGGERTRDATEELLKASGGRAAAGAEASWAGLWRVTYAPHIRTLGSLALTQVDVYYDIAASEPGISPEIRSFVRFEAYSLSCLDARCFVVVGLTWLSTTTRGLSGVAGSTQRARSRRWHPRKSR